MPCRFPCRGVAWCGVWGLFTGARLQQSSHYPQRATPYNISVRRASLKPRMPQQVGGGRNPDNHVHASFRPCHLPWSIVLPTTGAAGKEWFDETHALPHIVPKLDLGSGKWPQSSCPVGLPPRFLFPQSYHSGSPSLLKRSFPVLQPSSSFDGKRKGRMSSRWPVISGLVGRCGRPPKPPLF